MMILQTVRLGIHRRTRESTVETRERERERERKAENAYSVRKMRRERMFVGYKLPSLFHKER